MATVHVRLPDHLDVDWLVEQLIGGLIDNHHHATIDIGRGQRINGIPINTILVQVEEA